MPNGLRYSRVKNALMRLAPGLAEGNVGTTVDRQILGGEFFSAMFASPGGCSSETIRSTNRDSERRTHGSARPDPKLAARLGPG
jgi:hypothetical protein